MNERTANESGWEGIDGKYTYCSTRLSSLNR